MNTHFQPEHTSATPLLRREEKPGFCTLCRSRCGSLNIIENGRLVAVKPLPSHPTGKALCPKGRAAPEIVHSARRLTTPLRRTQPKTSRDPGWEQITWDEALDTIAGKMREIVRENGPEAVAFSFTTPSATSLSDSLPWLERFVWNFGSPNLAYATELCNWHKDHAAEFTFGAIIGVPDYRDTDLIVLWGHNPTNSWLAQAEAIGEGRRRGAKLIVVDPRKTALASQADLWVRVRPGSDGALALGVMRLMFEQKTYDDAFVRRWTNAPLLVRGDTGAFLRADAVGLGGADAFVVWDGAANAPAAYDTARALAPDLAGRVALDGRYEIQTAEGLVECRPAFALLREAADDYTPERVTELTWVPAKQLQTLAAMLAAAPRACHYGWTGIGQHTNATQTDRAISLLFGLKDWFDASGGNVLWGAHPVKPLSSYDDMPEAQKRKALGLQERPIGPPSQGWITGRDLSHAILEGEPYRVRALIGFGANIVVSHGDQRTTQRALEALEFQVHCDLFMSPTAQTADIILPVGTAWEREALRVGFEITPEAQEHVQLRQRMVEPVGESRSDMWIAAELAKRLGFGEKFFDGDFDKGWNYSLEPLGITVDDLRAKPEGIRIPLQHRFRKYAEETGSGVRGFNTPTRRIEIYSERMHVNGIPPVPRHVEPGHKSGVAADRERFPYVLTTAKDGYYCHSQQRGIASLRRRSPVPRVYLHPSLAAEKGITEGSAVRVATAFGAITMAARLEPDLDARVVAADYGWWQACPDLGAPGFDVADRTVANFNSLISAEARDPVSGAPGMRSSRCDIALAPPEHAAAFWEGFEPLRVVDVRNEAHDTVSILLARPDGGLLPPYQPGQFLTVALDEASAAEGCVRSYSLSGDGREACAQYRVSVKKVAEGLVSSKLVDDLKPGQTILAQLPSGRFVLPLRNEFPVVLVAGGIGITPFMSYLEMLARQPRRPEVWLYYGVRNGQEHAFKARLDALAAQMPELHVVTFYSRPGEGDRIGDGVTHHGRLAAHRFDPSLVARRARFYLCGPDAMMADVVDALVTQGVPRFEIFQERFVSPRPLAAPSADAKHRIRFARSGVELEWTPESGSILDLAEKNGVRIPTGCRVGQCESCFVGVVEGEAACAVANEDLEEGGCLTCQAIPLTDMTLDA
jgi:anaerobic selenocysteine-containing dehydrogenase/ferredoxin-NADP reductase